MKGIKNQEFVCALFKKYVRVNFENNYEAGAAFGVHYNYIGDVSRGQKPPNADMLEAIGYERVKGFRKVRK